MNWLWRKVKCGSGGDVVATWFLTVLSDEAKDPGRVDHESVDDVWAPVHHVFATLRVQ